MQFSLKLNACKKWELAVSAQAHGLSVHVIKRRFWLASSPPFSVSPQQRSSFCAGLPFLLLLPSLPRPCSSSHMPQTKKIFLGWCVRERLRGATAKEKEKKAVHFFVRLSFWVWGMTVLLLRFFSFWSLESLEQEENWMIHTSFLPACSLLRERMQFFLFERGESGRDLCHLLGKQRFVANEF